MGLFNKPRAPQPPKEEPPQAPVAPSALTKEDVQLMIEGATKATADQLTGVISGLREGIESLAGRPVAVQQQVQPVYEQPITDEDIDNAVASGQGASKIVRQLLDRQARDVRVGLETRIGQLEAFGAQAIGSLNVEKLQNREHYKRFKKEIDLKVNALPDSYKANPQTLDLIYNAVVGEHEKELTNEAHEKALRQAAEGDTGTRPVNEIDVRASGSKPGTGSAREKQATATAEEFAGKEGLMALQHKERGAKDPDAFAQSMGYQSWDAYIKQYEQLRSDNGDN